ncbi:hypothetical protein SI65_00354 [Aspergillus cristatus]|uniref:Zn(2)-C6 fungal-type domain-containing protein n=1 Tax=Aspergillus cristatus TaxID=573508 RepID=A0A1E3BP78_ASPCR|nr:hypothetical protein SI65_00354 [Aspergillus cristatus]
MARPSPLACIECRQHHVKCDAKTPSCSRCLDTGISCKYLPSRRGRNRKARDGRRPESSSLVPEISRPGDSRPLGGNIINSPFSSMGNITKDNASITSGEHGQGLLPGASAQNDLDPDTRLVRQYYENFHSAHPILVPANEYERRGYPECVRQVVRFIGSHYSLLISSESLRESTAVRLSSNDTRSPSMVKALLLYSIILYARGENTEAQTSFSRAVDGALELGMHRKEFATMYCDGQELKAESLRRTWWELTIMEIYMASSQKKITLRCGSIAHDVGLPCEESIYANSSTIPPAPSFSNFSRRMFLDDDGDTTESRYSSYSYRIDAAYILARVLVLNSLGETHRDHLQAVENALVSWTNHLPPNKVDIVDTYGVVDEMLFQAHTIIQYAAMLLHLPRSNIRPAVPDAGTVRCPITPARLPPSFTRHVHDIKATEASKQLSNLLSMRPNVQRYSPFIICSLALCGLVQLATSRIHSPECSEHHRNRVVLVLGCLKVLKRNWSIAQHAYQHVRQAAAETFAASSGPSRWFQGHGSSNSSATLKNGPASGRSSVEGPELLNVGGNLAAMPPTNTDGQDMFSQGLLSAYIDPTCSDPSFLNNIFDMELT